MTHPWDGLNMSCKVGLGVRQGDVQDGLKDQRDGEVTNKERAEVYNASLHCSVWDIRAYTFVTFVFVPQDYLLRSDPGIVSLN